jgi:hypothetical protein
MLKPFFVRSRQLERPLAAPAAAGTMTLPVAGAANFLPGDLLFIAHADQSLIESLGPVQTVTSSTVTATFPLRTARSVTATLWRPAATFHWKSLQAAPVERSFQEGIHLERTLGGGFYAVRLAAPQREDTLRFPSVTRSEFEALRVWLAAHTRSGLDEFTWVDEYRQPARVRLAACDFEQHEQPSRVLALALRLIVLEEGGFA